MNTVYFYRLAPDGTRLRWRFVIDDNQTIVEEQPAPDNQETVAERAEGTGTLVIRSVSAEERKILGFFTDTTPCWFPSCEELRAKYKAEIDALAPGCPGCQKGAVIRKYQDLVRRASSAT